MIRISQFKLNVWIYMVFIGISCVIIADFILPDKSLTESIIEIKRERQQYYNAARNYHYSYRLFTNTASFNVSELFAHKADSSQFVNYSLSPIFNEVNGYSIGVCSKKSIYSLRIVSGLVLPFVGIIVMILALIHENKMKILNFVFQVLLVVDLIYLIN